MKKLCNSFRQPRSAIIAMTRAVTCSANGIIKSVLDKIQMLFFPNFTSIFWYASDGDASGYNARRYLDDLTPFLRVFKILSRLSFQAFGDCYNFLAQYFSSVTLLLTLEQKNFLRDPVMLDVLFWVTD
jgi:hypothetical protein